MFRNNLQLIVVTSWLVVVAALSAIRTIVGPPVTALDGIAALLLGSGPAVVLMVVFRGAPPQTIGEVIYDTEHTRNANASRDRVKL